MFRFSFIFLNLGKFYLYIGKDIAGVIGKLAAANCDALGLGRQAMLHASDWTAWRDMNWQQLYPALIWEIVIENS